MSLITIPKTEENVSEKQPIISDSPTITNEQLIAILKPVLDGVLKIDPAAYVNEVRVTLMLRDGAPDLMVDAYARNSRIRYADLASLVGAVKEFDPHAEAKRLTMERIQQLQSELAHLEGRLVSWANRYP
jgi:hypothetical protein